LLRNNITNTEELSKIIDNIEKYLKPVNIDNNENKKKCKACNKEFKTNQNYKKHLLTEKCKLKTNEYNQKNNTNVNNNTRLENINNSNVNINNNYVNNNFVVYPIGCETLEHIDKDKLKKFKKVKDYTIYTAKLLQLNEKNLNFTKQNMNKPYITILNSNMILEDIPETEFYINYLDNTERKTVELIYCNKNNLTKEEMIDIFRRILADQNKCKLNDKEHNKKLSLLKAVTHRTLRNKNIYNKLSNIENNTKSGLNNLLIENLKKIKKQQFLIDSETRVKPIITKNKENDDIINKNLYNIIKTAEEKNKTANNNLIKELYNIDPNIDINYIEIDDII